MKRFLRVVLAVSLLPMFALAQSDAGLRSQIRADLMSDPRTAQLSEAELDALVEALATEAIETGEAATYLEVKSAPTFTYDPLPAAESTIGSILSAPIVIALFALLAGIAGVILFVLRHRRSQPEMPESA